MSGFDGSIATSTTPVFSLMVSTAFQVFPPSVDLKSPRSPPAPHSGPSAATYTTFESRGSMTTRPICSDFFSPRFSNSCPHRPTGRSHRRKPHSAANCFLPNPPTPRTHHSDRAPPTQSNTIPHHRTPESKSSHHSPSSTPHPKPR